MSPAIILISLVTILALLGGGYYLGTKAKSFIRASMQSSSTPTPTTVPKSATASLAPVIQTQAPAIPQSSLPSDIPLFVGAKIAYATRVKSCGYQQNDRFCEVNSFIYQIPKPGLSVDEVLNFYVSNPNPSWIYGTPTFSQANSGKITKGDTYFIIRIAGLNGTDNGVQLTFEGPYLQK